MERVVVTHRVWANLQPHGSHEEGTIPTNLLAGAVIPAALSSAQLWRTLASVAMRELLWGFRLRSVERQAWEKRARGIPDEQLREDALQSLRRSRGHTDGAALFWTISHRRCPALLRALYTYQVILEFLDDISERSVGHDGGHQLHRALTEAVDPEVPISDYYRFYPVSEDGGYLDALVQSCRSSCLSLPSYELMRPRLVYYAGVNATAQRLNHAVSSDERDRALREWASEEFSYQRNLYWWWETAAAASSSLSVLALLALAADSAPHDATQILAVFMPGICALSTLLDSYVDQAEDAEEENHSYLGHYESPTTGSKRLIWFISTSAQDADTLQDGHRYTIILASMIAMYLSKDSALTRENSSTTATLLKAAGPLASILWPLVRLWRTVYSLRAV